MAINYPGSKDTWARKVNRDLSVGEVGDDLDQEDYNGWADWIEALQDTLGLGIKMGYGTVKLFFDWVVAQIGTIATKVSKAGDTMTGDLTIQKQYPKISLDDNVAGQQADLRIESSQLQLRGPGISLRTNGTSRIGISLSVIKIYLSVEIPNSDIEFEHKDFGVILKSPDASRWRVTINDAGTLVTTKL